MILEGNITIPYKWTAGATVGRFLAELKENARLVGARCDGCGKVYVPPMDVCGECFKVLDDWVPLTGEGTVVAITTVEHAMPWSPRPVPYHIALVRLDGADTNLLHLTTSPLQAGDRVRTVFKTERIGSLLDINGFAHLAVVAAQPEASHDTEDEARRYAIPAQPDLLTEGITAPMEPITEVATIFFALPSRFRRELVVESLSFYFSIDDEQWTVLVTDEICEVHPGKTVESADCFLKTSAEIFLGTINGTYMPSMTDLLMGRIKTNNPFLLQKFRELFE